MRLLTLLSTALLTACAAAPVDRSAAPAPAAPPVASAPVASATLAEAASVPAAAGSAEPSAQTNDDIGEPAVAKAKPGYSLTKQNGQAVYCRREIPTGSRRPVTNCYTPEQLEAIEQATREMQNAMDRQRNSSGCGNFCSGGS
jgi:hypothetical protein